MGPRLRCQDGTASVLWWVPIVGFLVFASSCGPEPAPSPGCQGDGDCPSGMSCVGGTCQSVCVPNCVGLCCGDDGCGGTCEDDCADTSQTCNTNSCGCEGACVPLTCERADRECGQGSDGCGGTIDCGNCSGSEVCSALGQCVDDCMPQTCAQMGRECGQASDGCDGTLECGVCATGSCVAGQCDTSCQPDCVGKACGPDGCGGSCGSCSAERTCMDGVCECRPHETASCCGDDVCWQDSCGNLEGVAIDCSQYASNPYSGCRSGKCCWAPTMCIGGDVYTNGLNCRNANGQTTSTGETVLVTDCGSQECRTVSIQEAECSSCTPNCSGKACGPDGCGGSCGSCPANSVCRPDQQYCDCTAGYIADPTFTGCVRLNGACPPSINSNGYCVYDTWVWCDSQRGVVATECQSTGFGPCTTIGDVGSCRCGPVTYDGFCTGYQGGAANEIHVTCVPGFELLAAQNCRDSGPNGHCGAFVTGGGHQTSCFCEPCVDYLASSHSCLPLCGAGATCVALPGGAMTCQYPW